MTHLEGVECLCHAVPVEEVSNVVIDYFQSAHMFGLVILDLRFIVAMQLCLAEGATHQSLQFVDIFQTVLEFIQIVDVF